MNATTTFWPSASSPMSDAGPSASTSPAFTRLARCARSASGCSRCSGSSAGTWSGGRCPALRCPSPSARRRCASRRRSRPCRARLATTVTPESRATMPSMPVPTSGASVRISGTAWRCMLAPMSARFASSCSRNGTSAAATDTSWFGDTSISSTISGVTSLKSPFKRAETRVSLNLPFSSRLAVAWAMYLPSSSSAEYQVDLVGDPAVLDLAVGRLDEAVLVDAGVGRERRDEADVRTFRRLDRADAAVVGRRARRAPRSPRARGSDRPARGPRGAACG